VLTQAVEEAINAAMQDAYKRRQRESTEWHLLLALLDTHQAQIILGVQVERLRQEADHRIAQLNVVDTHLAYETRPSVGFQLALQTAWTNVLGAGRGQVDVEHVLEAITAHINDDTRLLQLRRLLSQPVHDQALAKLARASQWTEEGVQQVVLLNDHFTTQEFVQAVLVEHFACSPSEAMGLTLEVHKNGYAVLGCYPPELASALVEQVTQKAEARRFPLRLHLM